MNTVENYIYRVYIEKSFSKAAKLLHISQPSLSGAIAHKERELGFRIFDRSTKPISLTLQGGIYITMLTEFMESESNMRLKIDRLFNKEASLLCVGGSFTSAHFLMTHISWALACLHIMKSNLSKNIIFIVQDDFFATRKRAETESVCNN